MLQEKLPASKLTWFDADKCFIDGRWVKAQSGERLPSRIPRAGLRSARSRAGSPPTSMRRSRRPSARSAALGGGSPRPSAGDCSPSSPA